MTAGAGVRGREQGILKHVGAAHVGAPLPGATRRRGKQRVFDYAVTTQHPKPGIWAELACERDARARNCEFCICHNSMVE